MSGDAERALRAVLAERAGSVAPPAGLLDRVRRRNRVRRQLLVAAAAAGVVLVAAGIPVGRMLVRADAPPATPAPTPTPPPTAACIPRLPGPLPSAVPASRLPRQTGVRGSLAGDPAVVDAALVAGWQGLRRDRAELDRTGDRRALDARTVRLLFVERAGDGTLALATAADTTGRWQAAQWVVGRDRQLLPVGGPSGIAASPDFERKLGQLYYGDDPLYVSSQLVCGRTFGVVVAPLGTGATLAPPARIGADARLVRQPARPLPLTGGLAIFSADPSGGPKVTVSRGGVVLGERALNAEGGFGRGSELTDDQITQAVRDAAGTADPGLARSVAQSAGAYLVRVSSDKVTGIRILWGGRLPGGAPVVLAAVTVPSGAAYVSAAQASGSGASSSYMGWLPAGRLDDTVFAWRNETNNSVTVAATKAARAEVELPDGRVLPVQLTEGGGSVTVPIRAKTMLVRAYGADGALLGERVPGTGLIPLPSP